jgi:tetratricopeptide (TPR) repeat protein
MHMQSLGIRLALIGAIAIPLVSCNSLERLRALRVVKDAHTLYQRGDYENAVEMYLEVLADDPDMVDVYFYLANSYDQQYRASLRGERENDELLDNAIEHYITAVDRQPHPMLRGLSMQYLISAYGPEKANQPQKVEPVLQRLIADEPDNSQFYFQLAQLYEGSGLYQESEQVLLDVRNMRRDDPEVHIQLAGFYERNEQFEEMIESFRARAQIEPDNPEAFHIIGTHYWQKAFRDSLLTDEEEMEHIMLGLEEIEKALALNEDYVDALTYKNILMRLQANLTEDLDEREALIAEADVLRDRAQELIDIQRSGGAS